MTRREGVWVKMPIEGPMFRAQQMMLLVSPFRLNFCLLRPSVESPTRYHHSEIAIRDSHIPHNPFLHLFALGRVVPGDEDKHPTLQTNLFVTVFFHTAKVSPMISIFVGDKPSRDDADPIGIHAPNESEWSPA